MLDAFLLFFRSPPARKRRREEAKPDPPVPCYFLRRRVNAPLVAAARGEDVPPLFLQLQNAFLAIPRLFWVYL
jgi:hypothetical protein